MKTIHTLVQDIYKLMMSKRVPSDVDAEQAIEEFGENIKKLMRKEFVNREYGKASSDYPPVARGYVTYGILSTGLLESVSCRIR